MARLFSELVMEQAFVRAKAQCECEIEEHGHVGRCKQKLAKMMQGGKSPAAWEAEKIDPDGEAVLENCRIVCAACHNKAK